MPEPRFTVEDPRVSPTQPPAGDDLLPPVEPPSAGFIIQLFVIPAMIVLMIVAIWLAFNWLVRAASRPEDVVKGLEQGPSVARWQRANELADMLRNERFADFKRDGAAASSLARTLDLEIDAASMRENDVAFRMYLARALGRFDVQEGMDVLLKAATTNRDPREREVRDGAIQAIAERAYDLSQLTPPQKIENERVEPTLIQLSSDEDGSIRFQAAYALGKLGTPAAIGRLEELVDDPHADTRYNAAVALAHRGNAKGVETLAEMLDLEEHQTAVRRAGGKNVSAERGLIVHTAIDAIRNLAEQNPAADLTPVVEAIRQIVDAPAEELEKAQLAPQAQSEARRAQKALGSESPPAT